MAAPDPRATAQALVAEGQGILAADESTGTATKRLEAENIESTDQSRRDYRELLFTTPGLGEYVSGAILYDETIRSNTSDGRTMCQALDENGVIPGIKVDTGANALAGAEGEKITEGLDGLRERLEEYVEMGARFTKWRAVIQIQGDELPSDYAIAVNAHALARFAALSQEAGMAPCVEPEVLIDGDHSIERFFEVNEKTLRVVFAQLALQRVELEAMVLKPSMVIAGKEHESFPSDPQQVAEMTVACMRRVVPAAVPGICFLSGGQTPEQATEHLNLMNELGPQPWQLAFSYARALQEPVLKAWKGDNANWQAAQQALAHRAKMNSAARSGSYSPDMEQG
ncbi:MAG: fructose-bisphosphate aldolase class I [Actinomycetota bacterium]|nr:fructose-bisphosphate aldolase class I [Actinomycetota bacterium]